MEIGSSNEYLEEYLSPTEEIFENETNVKKTKKFMNDGRECKKYRKMNGPRDYSPKVYRKPYMVTKEVSEGSSLSFRSRPSFFSEETQKKYGLTQKMFNHYYKKIRNETAKYN